MYLDSTTVASCFGLSEASTKSVAKKHRAQIANAVKAKAGFFNGTLQPGCTGGQQSA